MKTFLMDGCFIFCSSRPAGDGGFGDCRIACRQAPTLVGGFVVCGRWFAGDGGFGDGLIACGQDSAWGKGVSKIAALGGG